MSNEKLISVIIPVYNSEQYLKECLDSVVNQIYRNIEIILINDGSADNSPEICLQYAAKDPRIRYISQENAGEAAARNRGLQTARGEYILFVDSDDLLTFDICEQVSREMQDYDLMFLNYQTFRHSAQICSRLSGPRVSKTDLSSFGREAWIHSVLGARKIVPAELNLNTVWAKAYSRQFLKKHDILFQQDTMIGEDLLFNLCVYLKSPKVCSLPMNAYFYRYNDFSIVHRYIQDYDFRNKSFIAELSRILEDGGLLELYQEELGYQKVAGLLQTFSSDIFHANNPKSVKEKKADYLALVSSMECREWIPSQMEKFGLAKKSVLYFAMKKLYFPVKILYSMKNLLREYCVKVQK